MNVDEFSPNAKSWVKVTILYGLILVVVIGFGIGVMTIANSFRNFVESKISQRDYSMYPDDMMLPGDPGLPLR